MAVEHLMSISQPTDVERALEAMENIGPAMRRAVEALHKIADAVTLTHAQMEAFVALVELGEIKDEQSS